MTFVVRPLGLDEMDAAARVHRASFDERLPWLAGLHTPEEDRAFFREIVFKCGETWGAFDGADLLGFIAFRAEHVDHLYVLPAFQRRGLGERLLALAKRHSPELDLWTFQKNNVARRFYEREGFVAVETTDGARNEEREPDVRYCWRRPSG